MVVVLAVAVIVVGALVFATIASLRNSNLAKNQSQATKLAQEGIERVRSGRDRNGSFSNFTMADSVDNWTDENLWSDRIENYCVSPCYFKLESVSDLLWWAAGGDIPSDAESLEDGTFKRVVVLSDEELTYWAEKKVTVIVTWTDFSGTHKSELTTILRNLNL